MARTTSELNEKLNKKNGSKPVQYSDEAPLIDIQIRGRKGKRYKSEDKKRLIGFVNTIARHSPFGRAVLEDAAKDGYVLVMENQRDSCGFCDKEAKVIALNPVLSDELLIATLAHESRHAQQFSRGAEDQFGVFNLKSELMYTRAMEADAETAAAATCHEIRVNSGNDGPWKEFAADSVEIASGFMSAASNPNSRMTDKMLQGAFNGWYQDIPMMTMYEEGYIIDVMSTALKQNGTEMPRYDRSVTSPEVVNLFCANARGNCYWANNQNVLDDKDKLSIDSETYNMAKKFYKVRKMRTGQKPDPTLDTLKVRFDLDDLSKPKERRAKQFSIKGPKQAMTASLVAKAVSKGR